MELRVLGCGDAFGSGGRFNTCFHVSASATRFLIDCGASSMIAIRRFGIDPIAIDTILLTHLHGDHFGGVPFFILDAQLVSRRTTPLTVAGPPGLGQRLPALMEAMFPGSSTAERKFKVEVVELPLGSETEINGVAVTPFEVRHPSGSPSTALRIACDGKTICYTGDTEWVDALVPAARDADLLIAEAYTAERPVRFHLDWATLKSHLPQINANRILLTHMSPDMLARTPDGYEAAEDGLAMSV
jgi:ribonuclease BN (tRNA processing enzyme)